MPEHTQEEWVAGTLLGFPAVLDTEGRPILEWNDWKGWNGEHAERAQANVELAAAAPDMLTALEAVLKEFDEWDDDEEEERNEGSIARNKSVRAYRAAKEAFAKAKGETIA